MERFLRQKPGDKNEIVFPSLEEQGVFNPARPPISEWFHVTRRAAVTVIALMLVLGGLTPVALAAPSQAPAAGALRAQNVDWMSSDMASSLDIGMNVMVPTWIPAPFTGMAPSVTAGGGYYQLYWMVAGGAPTFLYIEGTVGGSLPAGSPADLNKQLSINASVQGWEAIHDIGIPAGSDTPIYDQVWWIANGVLYTVSSNNMTGSDSLSVANSLVVLQPPAVAEPATEPPYVPPAQEEPVEEPVVEEPVSGQPDAPAVTTDPRTVDTGTVSESPLVVSESSNTQEGSGDTAAGGTASDSGPWSPGRFDANIPTDGTSGPMPPVIGGDGTGGMYDTSLPNILFQP